MKKKTLLLVLATSLLSSVGTFVVLGPSAQFQRNPLREMITALLLTSHFDHTNYSNYVPGKSDEERWNWIELNT